MRVILALAMVVLAGCMAEPEVERPSYRDRSVPIASQVDVISSDLEGRWSIRSEFTSGEVLGRISVRRDEDDGGLVVFYFPTFDLPEGVIVSPSPDVFILTENGQGRWRADTEEFTEGPFGWRISQAGGDGSLWVLWADADRRTMAIGTPDGSFGFILDRNDTGGEDRIAAALDIMEWMGYRVDEMVTR